METYYIYKFSYADELLYVGSTEDVDKRIRLHKSSLKNNNTIYFYEYLRENDLNFDDLRLVIINFDCKGDFGMALRSHGLPITGRINKKN